MEFSIEKFNEVKNEAENFYSKIEKIKCPYFEEYVYFNTKGFDHLIFKEWNKTRPVGDQFPRFRYLKLAPEVIANSKTLQGIWSTQKFERIHRKDGWIKVLKNTVYYEFIAVMNFRVSKVRVKVIVKEIDGGEKFFLSIIPFWGIDKKTANRVMYTGNSEID